MFYLGISAYYHDASVALLDSDGNLIDFKKEEWLSRVKGDKSFPRQSLLEMIKNHDLSEKNVTSISFYEKPVRAWITVLKHSVKYLTYENQRHLISSARFTRGSAEDFEETQSFLTACYKDSLYCRKESAIVRDII